MQKIKIKDFFINMSLFVFVLILCMFVLEITIRIISPTPFDPQLGLVPNRNMKFSVNLSGVSPVIDYTTNKWGFRGDHVLENIEDYYFILTIGGSTTECFYLDDKDTWPYHLQTLINNDSKNNKTIVQNAGRDGHSSRGHLLMMKNIVPKIKPDAIIFLVGINDLGLSLDTQRYLHNPDEEKGISYKLFSKSRLIRMIYSWKQAMMGEVALSKAAHGNIILKNLTQEESTLSLDYHEELISLQDYEKNIRDIIKIGQENNIRMIFMTQPILFDDTEYWSNIEAKTAWIRDEKLYLSAKTYAKMLEKYNQKLLDICVSESIECYDLANEIPHMGDYFYDMVHFNEKGSGLVSEKIYDYLKK
ncbi:MAG: SGNH/GDSL hydrolase family protein [Candidatus Aenigmarchaeota archaeon]|nr:SGNH/GDSL hydrolase family protein [Candidatus Aenigmarchaeota archaeon]